MATATKNSGASSNARSSGSMKFLIFEDNGGAYHWRIVAKDGAAMAQSSGFPSYEEAGRAVELVRGGAASARFEKRADKLLTS